MWSSSETQPTSVQCSNCLSWFDATITWWVDYTYDANGVFITFHGERYHEEDDYPLLCCGCNDSIWISQSPMVHTETPEYRDIWEIISRNNWRDMDMSDPFAD